MKLNPIINYMVTKKFDNYVKNSGNIIMQY